jgi:hypothetical protein
MRSLVRRWLPTILFGTIPGLVVLFGYLLPIEGLSDLSGYFIDWAVILAGAALFLGIVNVMGVHGGRIRRRQAGWPYSLVLVLAAAGAAVPPLMQVLGFFGAGASGPEVWFEATRIMFAHVIVPVGAALGGLVAFTLALSGFRLLRERRSLWAVIFLIVAVITLLGTTPLAGPPGDLAGDIGMALAEARSWVMGTLAMPGMRGLLLGVALGTVVTALRVLATIERPHSES